MKVALSGVGGDELLGGYPSFRQVPRLVRALRWSRHIRAGGVLALACLLAKRFPARWTRGGIFDVA